MNKLDLKVDRLYLGNCVDMMHEHIPDNSIDLSVTDPPYGLNFMGKNWDKVLPPREAFEELFRVLKPGALAFIMSSPRQDLLWRMLAMLEGVGFELTQSYIDWIYKTGFPKAYDVSKGIDKKIGRINQSVIDIKKKLIELFDKSGKTRNQIDKECGFRACNYLSLPKEGKRPDPWTHILPTLDKWLIIKKVIGYTSNELDEIFIEAEREVIGIGYREGDPSNWYKSKKRDPTYITAPASNLSTKWSGWKSQTGLKPAHEPILMVNKPFSESTIVDNVLRWGTGAINVDACRIPYKSNQDYDITAKKNARNALINRGELFGGYGDLDPSWQSNKGRFPANLLVSDKAIDTGELSKSGKIEPHHNLKGDVKGKKTNLIYGTYTQLPAGKETTYGDVGDQSRYFDLDAWAEHHGFLDVPKPDSSERDFGLSHLEMDAYEVVEVEVTISVCSVCGKQNLPLDPCRCEVPVWVEEKRLVKRRRKKPLNIHPTVKPVKLMAYLIELGCPPGGVVLDPFMGSGTTCISAKRLLRRYIGIELKPEYYEIAKERVNATPHPMGLFKNE